MKRPTYSDSFTNVQEISIGWSKKSSELSGESRRAYVKTEKFYFFVIYITNAEVISKIQIKYISCVLGFKFKLLTGLIKLTLGGHEKILDDDSLAWFLSGRQIVRTLRSRIIDLKESKIISYSNFDVIESGLDSFFYGEKLAWQNNQYFTKY